MKRSQIIREIKSIIATCGPTQPTIVTAEQVLDRLEQLGMLPPYNTELKRMDDTLSSIEYFEWEPEELIVTNVDVENKTVTFKTVIDE